MKKLFLTLSLFLVTMAIMAIPAKPGQWKTLKLNDGTEVRACLVGDEHGHYWLANGKAYTQINGSELYQETDKTIIQERANVRRQQANERRLQRRASKKVGGVNGHYFGEKKGIIILVNFSDLKMQEENDNAFFTRLANEKGFSEGNFKGSMADYFRDQSQGQFLLDFDVYGPVNVSHNYSYYGQNDGQDNDKYPAKMVIEAVNSIKNDVTDWSVYDWDGDGYVDQVYVIYAGKGEADGGDSDTIWPHEYALTYAQWVGDGSGPVTVAGGIKVDTYACGSELNGLHYTNGIGTMCHEFSHCLGYPDFYDTDYSGGWGMASWDLMDQGSYNGNGYQPAGYTSYERWMAGWQEPIVLENQDVNVTDMQPLQNGGNIYVIYNQNNRDEYFLLENRGLVGWDQSLPAEGLLILHVDYDYNTWANNQPNDDPSHQRMTWVAADNEYQYYTFMGEKYIDWDGMITDVYPYDNGTKVNNSFNKKSRPAAKFYDGSSSLSKAMTSSVENIAIDPYGNISFNFIANFSDSQGGQTAPEGFLFVESFDNCDGTGGNDGQWLGSIATSKLNFDDIPDNTGWESPNAYEADQCIKVGKSGTNGNITSPSFNVNGQATLTFRAGAWNSTNDGTFLIVSLPQGFTVSQTTTTRATPAEEATNTVTVEIDRGKFSDISLDIQGTGEATITFQAQKGRFFLDEVKVADNATTAISRLAPNTGQAHNAWFTLDGRRLNGTPAQKGIYIHNGKKVILR